MTPVNQSPQGFYGLGLAPKLLDVIEAARFKQPTPIQEQAIPIAISGQDVMGVAQTGTGKTLAFGLPMIQRLAEVKGRGLVILPTRELALQVDESLQRIGVQLGLRTAVLIGGEDVRKQIKQLARKPHIIIGTPGRINDHLQQKSLKVDDVKILVLDEADRMLDMGFAPQINSIVRQVPKDRQTMLFSATMPPEITKLATSYMKLPVRVEIARSGTTAEQVTQELFVVQKAQKPRLLEKMLADYKGTVLVFTRTKFAAKKLCRQIKALGMTAAELHSNRSLNQRKEALEGFKRGKYRVLVATDIAARGIHVSGIELVINYDVPEHAEDYVHRIGRTGRAGHKGHAISFASPDQGNLVRDIEKLVRVHLPVSKLPELPAARPDIFVARDENPRARNFQRGGARSGRGSARSFAAPRVERGGHPFTPRFGGGSKPKPQRAFRERWTPDQARSTERSSERSTGGYSPRENRRTRRDAGHTPGAGSGMGRTSSGGRPPSASQPKRKRRVIF